MTYTTAAEVEKAFNTLFEGNFVERVDEREMNDSRGQTFKLFYIHFLPGTSIEMEYFKEKMERDGMVQVMTGRGKWFWKVYPNKSKAACQPVRKGPRIMTEEDEQLFLQWKATRIAETTAFTQEELDVLDESQEKLTEDELDELDDEHAAAAVHLEEQELMAIADEMAK
jgi:hypothetical protein